MLKKIIALLATIIFLDRLLKAMAVSGVFSEPVRLVGSIFQLSFTKNFAIAFSLPLYGVALELIIGLIIFGLLYYFVKLYSAKDYPKAACLVSILLGAASNLFDRLKYGYVIDYLDVKYFTVFNLADMMIVGGAAGLLFFLKKSIK
ncbi:MAG: signal peptidase II [bacterium]|nr:signal peptidase II [bacterium]